jgi:uncharacterized protein YjbI with pentapeptide repeats
MDGRAFEDRHIKYRLHGEDSMNDASTWPPLQVREDLSDLGANPPKSPPLRSRGVSKRKHTLSFNGRPTDPSHLGFTAPTRSFVAVGTAIALISLVWIAYGAHKHTLNADVIVAGSATVLLLLLVWLTYLAIKHQESSPETSARLAEVEHIESASKNLGADSPPGRLGALYMLEQVGIGSREVAASVLNSLLNFIRTKTAIAPDGAECSAGKPVTDDVQTALAILGRLRTLGQLPLYLKVDLSRCDLTGASLRDWDFSGVDLHHSLLNAADLNNANFDNANLQYCSFRRARIVGASFKWAIMFGADLTDAFIIGCDLRNAMLGNATMTRTEIHNSRLQGAILSNARITDMGVDDVDIDIARTADIDDSGTTSAA